MTLRNLTVLSLLATVALPGCDDGGADSSERSCDVVAPAFRKIGLNGTSLNGTSLNGVSVNGVSLNGTEDNGVSLNGTDENGVSLNGTERNGVSLNGKSLNGKSLNGKSLNGVKLNGVSMNGVDLGTDVELVGSALHGVDADGEAIAGEDWVGARIVGRVGEFELPLHITAVEQDAEDASIEWYTLEYQGSSLCGEGHRGTFVAGVWDETGARHDALADDAEVAFTFSCDNGALGKCVDWGYAPYAVGADAHQSCARMVRADYCGNGEPHTADGTTIDVFDTLGVQHSDAAADASLGLEFEAGWGPNGAVCVSRSRYTEIGTNGDEIAVSCWDELPACDTAEEAIALGADLLNRSAELTLCYE